MKATWLLIASIICFSICINTLSYGQNIANANNKELILVIEVTRHGARSPIGPPNTWLNTTWEVGTGQLTNIGERQQYLNGVKLRKMYIEDAQFLPDQFDPKYFYVKSSDFNRTVMSAISQMQGLYPLEKGLAFSSNSEKQQAMPPFPITEPNDYVNSDDVLPSRATTVPVHVQLNKYDFLLRAYDSLVCPIMGELKEEGEEEADENSQKELKPLYNELREKFGVPDENLNLAGAEFYIDSYVMGKLEGKTLPNELSIQAQQLLDSYYKHLYFDGIYAFK